MKMEKRNLTCIRSKAQQAAFERLDAMRGYCESDSCLRGVILDYFGDDHDGDTQLISQS